MIHDNMDVDFWSQAQTLNPAPSKTAASAAGWYTGYDPIELHWSALVPELPLTVRYQSFERRLAKALSSHD